MTGAGFDLFNTDPPAKDGHLVGLKV